MIKEFVPYKLAVQLKELGFNEDCFGVYGYEGSPDNFCSLQLISKKEEFTVTPHDVMNNKIGSDVSAPLISQAFRWIREHHLLIGIINFGTKGVFRIDTLKGSEIKLISFKEKFVDTLYDTYEETELACLEFLIQTIKNKNEKIR